tara:strand:- start:244 stop:786 length:543 start_codon:yes stop_codon:yes gene_type:complete
MNDNKKYIYNAVDFDTAIEVNNYPWGFRLKTKVKYWIESNNKGDRLIKQTLNPKTNEWCKPKKSTYSEVMVMTSKRENDKTFISYEQISMYSNIKEVSLFENTHKNHLTNRQRENICMMKSMHGAYEDIEVKMVCTSRMTKKELEDHNKKKRLVEDYLLNRANSLYNTCLIKNNLKGETS